MPDNPFKSTFSLSHSSYLGVVNGALTRLRTQQQAARPAELLAHDQIVGTIQSASFPCVGAKAAIKTGTYRFGFYPALGSDEATAGLAVDLYEFVQERRSMPGDYTTFIATFKGPFVENDEAFDAILWRQLQRLSDLDSRFHDWDLRVSSDPANSEFSFSFAEEAFFIVAGHPASQRYARHPSAWPTLAFNAKEQFTKLREKGMFSRLQGTIRDRDKKLSGSINPNLAEFGEAPESLQYSPLPKTVEWKCPFQAARRSI